jgi:hypothetical protein
MIAICFVTFCMIHNNLQRSVAAVRISNWRVVVLFVFPRILMVVIVLVSLLAAWTWPLMIIVPIMLSHILLFIPVYHQRLMTTLMAWHLNFGGNVAYLPAPSMVLFACPSSIVVMRPLIIVIFPIRHMVIFPPLLIMVVMSLITILSVVVPSLVVPPLCVETLLISRISKLL